MTKDKDAISAAIELVEKMKFHCSVSPRQTIVDLSIEALTHLRAHQAQTVTDDARREALAWFNNANWNERVPHIHTIRAALSTPQQDETEGTPCVSCDKPSQRETPDGDMCLECYANFSATCAGNFAEALRDVLKAICTPDNGVTDTIFVNSTPIGDFISCELGEDIDYDDLQKGPYRCKRTKDIFDETEALKAVVRDLSEIAFDLLAKNRSLHSGLFDKEQIIKKHAAIIEAVKGADND